MVSLSLKSAGATTKSWSDINMWLISHNFFNCFGSLVAWRRRSESARNLVCIFQVWFHFIVFKRQTRNQFVLVIGYSLSNPCLEGHFKYWVTKENNFVWFWTVVITVCSFLELKLYTDSFFMSICIHLTMVDRKWTDVCKFWITISVYMAMIHYYLYC